MWRTPSGIRKLRGAEARLFLASVVGMLDDLSEDGKSLECGSRAFDRMSPEQQRYAILAVAQNLTNKRRPMPLVSWAEAVVYAVYEYALDRVETEIDITSSNPAMTRYVWRKLVRDAFAETWKENLQHVPALTSSEIDDWDFCIEFLSDAILWDRDFLDEDIYDGTECLPDYFAKEPREVSHRRRRDLLRFYGLIRKRIDRLAG